MGTSEIVDTLWVEEAPISAVNVVRRYVGSLRRLLEPGLPAPGARTPAAAPLRRLPAGRTGGREVDLLRLRGLTRRGGRAVSTGRPDVPVAPYAQALSQWRGPVVMGIPESVRGHVAFTAVGQELVQVTQWAADAALLCGRAEDVREGNPTGRITTPRRPALANSHHRSHPAQTRALHRYLRWRNAHARHPDVLAAQRRERAHIRSEKGIRWGRRARCPAA
ncbi:BTAD domain-containing putative transcriptional regulator [Streptomyces sp. YKOK-I1]